MKSENLENISFPEKYKMFRDFFFLLVVGKEVSYKHPFKTCVNPFDC